MAKKQSFAKMLEDLKNCQWYWGAITPSAASRLLDGKPPGTFLVRDSRSEKSIFSFSFTAGNAVYHTRINCFNGNFCLGGPKSLIRSESLPDFVELILRACSPSPTGAAIPQPSNPEQPGSSSSSTALTELVAAEESRSLRVLMHTSTFMNPAAEQINIRYPLYRNQFVPTLKGACRLAIRRLITDNTQIDSLPVPRRLKKYLAASDYLLCFDSIS